MMKLIGLKLSKSEAKEESGLASKPDLPRYPYGTRLRLDSDLLEKLGIDLDDYDVGEDCSIEAVGRVIGKDESERLEGSARSELEIQIVKIGIEPSKTAKREKKRDAHIDAIGAATSYAEPKD